MQIMRRRPTDYLVVREHLTTIFVAHLVAIRQQQDRPAFDSRLLSQGRAHSSGPVVAASVELTRITAGGLCSVRSQVSGNTHPGQSDAINVSACHLVEPRALVPREFSQLNAVSSTKKTITG